VKLYTSLLFKKILWSFDKQDWCSNLFFCRYERK